MKPLTKHSLEWSQRYIELANQARDPQLKRFYNTGVCAGNTPLKEVEFVALDFETTGLEPKKNDIVSIGLVPFNHQRIFCNQAKHWVVNPRQPLDENSVVVHGITHSDIEEAPDLRRILVKLLDALSGKIIVVHYQRIERLFMDQALKLRLGEGISFPVVDTMAIESAYQREINGTLLKRLMGKKPASVRLGKTRQRYNLPPYPPHHALSDALATAELLQAQIAYHYSPDTPIEQLWL
ncbi:3'-5' exonuclease [Thaumasiovibrio sp. DFM-14]|uniref:3'-5' exonuclease n=1 Tax=Thaumasiovibrio sp. DFM-14 TaxID=3384792 RepID=UPI0039A0D754